MEMTSFVVTFLCSSACSAFTWFLAFDSGKKFGKSLAEIAFSREKAELEAKTMERIGHARSVHIRDLGNLISRLRRGPSAAVDYLDKALAAVESDPTVDQKVPEDLR